MVKIKALKEEIKKIKRSKKKKRQKLEAVKERSKESSKSTKMDEIILSQAQKNTTSKDILTVSVVRQTKRQSYKLVITLQPS